MTPYPLPASRIERSVSPPVSRRDGTMKRYETKRCDETRYDEAKRRARRTPHRPVGMTSYSAGEYGTMHRIRHAGRWKLIKVR